MENKRDEKLSRKEITKMLTNILHLEIGRKADFNAREISFDFNKELYMNNIGLNGLDEDLDENKNRKIKEERVEERRKERVDYLVYERKYWKFFEIKSCEEDFKSSASWTFLGNYNYFVMPQSVYDRVESIVPSYVGVYTIDDKYLNKRTFNYIKNLSTTDTREVLSIKYLKNVKRAKFRTLANKEEEYFKRTIKSLNRDAEKYYQRIGNKSDVIIKNLEKDLRRTQGDLKNERSLIQGMRKEIRILFKLLENEGYERKEINNILDEYF